MTDNQIFAILLPLISGGLAARGMPNVTVAQKYQPTQQGTPSAPSAFLFKLYDVPRGHVRRDSIYDDMLNVMIDTELQNMEVTFQVSALAIQDPNNVNAPTASDIVRKIRQVLQSSATIALLKTNGLAILRVNELRNPPFVDDKQRFEFEPSFDFTLIYDELYQVDGLVIETVEYNINRV